MGLNSLNKGDLPVTRMEVNDFQCALIVIVSIFFVTVKEEIFNFSSEYIRVFIYFVIGESIHHFHDHVYGYLA